MAQIPTSCQDQLNILISRGLIIDVPFQDVLKFLECNNYYRFRGYTINFCNVDPTTKTESFNGKTTFSEIKNIYDCDAVLRKNLRDLLEVNEIFLRTIYVLFLTNYSSDAYFIYDDQFFSFNQLRESKIQEVRRSVKKLTDIHKHSLIVKRYFDKNTRICKLPGWAFIEFMSFGDVSKMYESTDFNYIDYLCSSHFKFQQNSGYNYLTSWTKSLAKLRNACHHYERLYYKKFTESPPRIFKDPLFSLIYNMNTSNNQELFSLVVISVIMCPDPLVVQSFIKSITALKNQYPNIDFNLAYGFPSDWDTILNSLSGFIIK